jgi:hypothetical protein
MNTKEQPAIRSARARRQSVVAPALLLAFVSFATGARAQEAGTQPGSGAARTDFVDVSETGKKLANPLSNVWALFTEFDFNFSDGKLNPGHQQAGSRMIFQPIIPIPLFGGEDNEWKLITRPTIPFLFSQAIPGDGKVVDRKGGLGDIQLPLIISPPVKKWIPTSQGPVARPVISKLAVSTMPACSTLTGAPTMSIWPDRTSFAVVPFTNPLP